ncbi:MAG: phosphatase PAP2 family protein, partial [Gemmatimonadales bacterium]
YTAAAGTGWSRMNDHKHWFSDVVAGALLGYASAKFASGRMEIFGLRAPAIMPREDGVVLQWSESW